MQQFQQFINGAVMQKNTNAILQKPKKHTFRKIKMNKSKELKSTAKFLIQIKRDAWTDLCLEERQLYELWMIFFRAKQKCTLYSTLCKLYQLYLHFITFTLLLKIYCYFIGEKTQQKSLVIHFLWVLVC